MLLVPFREKSRFFVAALLRMTAGVQGHGNYMAPPQFPFSKRHTEVTKYSENNSPNL